MARRMALFANRVFLSSSSESLRGTALSVSGPCTPAIYHASSLRTYAAAAAKSKTASKSMDAKTVNDITKESNAKRPRNAYQLFQSQFGPEILAKHKGATIGERSQLMAAAWKKMSEQEKADLQARVVLDAPAVPAKMPRSAYQLWMKQSGPEILKQLGGTFDNVGQRAKLLSAEWKKVSEEEKTRLQGELEKLSPAREKPLKKKASSPYQFYVQECFSKEKKEGMKATEVMKALGNTWKTMSDSEKAEYKKKVAESQ